MMGIIFILIFLGLLVGKIKIFRVRIGFACVLILSLLFGVLMNKVGALEGIVPSHSYSFLTNFGTALFISAVGLQAGTESFQIFGYKQLKVIVCSVCMVTIGFGGSLCIGCFDPNITSDILVGLFSGSMTSTPAMSVGVELYGISSQVSLGYGMSYVVGRLSVV